MCWYMEASNADHVRIDTISKSMKQDAFHIKYVGTFAAYPPICEATVSKILYSYTT